MNIQLKYENSKVGDNYLREELISQALSKNLMSKLRFIKMVSHYQLGFIFKYYNISYFQPKKLKFKKNSLDYSLPLSDDRW